MSAPQKHLLEARRAKTRFDYVTAQHQTLTEGISVDYITPSGSSHIEGTFGANAIVMVNDSSMKDGQGRVDDVGLLVDDNRLFTRRNLLQVDSLDDDQFTISTETANIRLFDTYAETANIKTDFVETLDGTELTFNALQGEAKVTLGADSTTGAKIESQGTMLLQEGSGSKLAINPEDAKLSIASDAVYVELDNDAGGGNVSVNTQLKVDRITEFTDDAGVTFGRDEGWGIRMDGTNNPADDDASESRISALYNKMVLVGDDNGGADQRVEVVLGQGNVATDDILVNRIAPNQAANLGLELGNDDARLVLKEAPLTLHNGNYTSADADGLHMSADGKMRITAHAGDADETKLDMDHGYVSTEKMFLDVIEPLTSNTAGLRIGQDDPSDVFGVTIQEGDWNTLGNSSVSTGTLVQARDKLMLKAGDAGDASIELGQGVAYTKSLKVNHILEGDDTNDLAKLTIGTGQSQIDMYRSEPGTANEGSRIDVFANASSLEAANLNILTVNGQLDVKGNLTFIDSATLQVDDKNITLAYIDGTSENDSSADGGGITILSTTTQNKELNWNASLAPNAGMKLTDGTALPNASTDALSHVWRLTDELMVREVHTGALKSIYSNNFVQLSGGPSDEGCAVANDKMYIDSLMSNDELFGGDKVLHIGDSADVDASIDVDYTNQTLSRVEQLESQGATLTIQQRGVTGDAKVEITDGDVKLKRELQANGPVLELKSLMNTGNTAGTIGQQLWLNELDNRFVNSAKTGSEFATLASTENKPMRLSLYETGLNQADVSDTGAVTDAMYLGFDNEYNVSNLTLMVDQIQERSDGNGVLIEGMLLEDSNVTFTSGVGHIRTLNAGRDYGQSDTDLDGMSIMMDHNSLSLGSDQQDYNYILIQDGDDTEANVVQMVCESGNVELYGHHEGTEAGAYVKLANDAMYVSKPIKGDADANGYGGTEGNVVIMDTEFSYGNLWLDVDGGQNNATDGYVINMADNVAQALTFKCDSNIVLTLDTRNTLTQPPRVVVGNDEHSETRLVVKGVFSLKRALDATYIYGEQRLSDIPYTIDIDAHVMDGCPPTGSFTYYDETGAEITVNNASANPQDRLPKAMAYLLGNQHHGNDGLAAYALGSQLSADDEPAWNVVTVAPCFGYVSAIELFADNTAVDDSGSPIDLHEQLMQVALLRRPGGRFGDANGDAQWHVVETRYMFNIDRQGQGVLQGGRTTTLGDDQGDLASQNSSDSVGWMVGKWDGKTGSGAGASKSGIACMHMEVGWASSTFQQNENLFAPGDEIAFAFQNLSEHEIQFRGRITFSSLGLNFDKVQQPSGANWRPTLANEKPAGPTGPAHLVGLPEMMYRVDASARDAATDVDFNFYYTGLGPNYNSVQTYAEDN